MLYLACIDIASLSEPERQSRAYDLSVAALASDTIYNFGELLLHPILDSLKGTRHAWLRELLIAYNQGDLSVYDRLASNLASDELLHQNQQFLYQKMSLSALTETFFERPSHQRAMTFADIIHETKVQPDEIEHLIMKALSLGLIRGTVDQVSRIARVSWVQPKVLDMGQIDSMLGRLQDWDRNVNQLGTWIESTGGDVWAT